MFCVVQAGDIECVCLYALYVVRIAHLLFLTHTEVNLHSVALGARNMQNIVRSFTHLHIARVPPCDSLEVMIVTTSNHILIYSHIKHSFYLHCSIDSK